MPKSNRFKLFEEFDGEIPKTLDQVDWSKENYVCVEKFSIHEDGGEIIFTMPGDLVQRFDYVSNKIEEQQKMIMILVGHSPGMEIPWEGIEETAKRVHTKEEYLKYIHENRGKIHGAKFRF